MHCAASISFDLPLDEARAINVDGTARVLDFAVEAQARDGGLERFLHVSTAYVAGRYEGTFRERQLDTGQAFRNTYEETKFDAERSSRSRASSAPRSRARASSWASPTPAGPRPSTSSTGRCAPSRAGCSSEVPALADGHVDIVPIDYVADSLVHLLGRREAGVFNLVSGRNAPQVAEVVNLASDYFGKPHPKLVEPVAPEHLGDDQGDVFVPYFDMRVVFDDARARAVLGPAGIEAPILRDYFGRLMEYAETARWGKQGISREAARRSAVPV